MQSEGIINLGGDNGPMGTRSGVVRAVNSTFVVNTARPALVCYSVRITPGTGGQGRVDLLSDAATPPTTVLASVGMAAGGGGGWTPAAIGSIDGVTVPGTPTFTGTGIAAIAQNAAGSGVYDLTLSAALNLANGAGCQGVMNLSPVEGDAVPPTIASPPSFKYTVTDPTHVTIWCYDRTAVLRDAKMGLAIWPIENTGGGSSGSVDVMVAGMVWAGHNVRLAAVAVAGAPSFTVVQSMEYVL